MGCVTPWVLDSLRSQRECGSRIHWGDSGHPYQTSGLWNPTAPRARIGIGLELHVVRILMPLNWRPDSHCQIVKSGKCCKSGNLANQIVKIVLPNPPSVMFIYAPLIPATM